MADTSATGVSVKFLLLGSQSIIKNVKWSAVLLFAELLSLIKSVSENICSTDAFELIIPGIRVKEVMDDPIYHMEQVRVIYLYYNSQDDLNRDKTHIKDEYGKFRFCLTENLPGLIQKLKATNAINSSRSNYRETTDDVAGSATQHLSEKRSSPGDYRIPAPKRIAYKSGEGFVFENVGQINSRCYICPFCNVLFRDPHQLECGHRICQPCIKNDNDRTPCLNCPEISMNSNIWRDRSFRKDMERLPVTCLLCDWTGLYENYEKHTAQNHSGEENAVPVVDVYAQQTLQSTLGEPVHTVGTRRRIMSDMLRTSLPIYTPNNSHDHVSFEHLNKGIYVNSNPVNMICNDQQRLNTELRSSQASIPAINQNSFPVNRMLVDTTSRATGLKISQDLYAQQLWPLTQHIENARSTSYDGTYTWKIPQVREKIVDARSERQKSIYSPPFYSSPTGYKMRLRLYLNGDADTRDTHLSLFLVIMRGDHDDNVTWPFGCQVLFRLIDQSTLNDRSGGIIRAFSPDIRSDCFKRPECDMNSAYGFKEFLSIKELKQHQDVYIVDDTLFIQVKIGFSNENWPISTLACGSPNDEEHVGVISEDFMHIS